MRTAQALDLVSCYDSTRNHLTSLGNSLDPELISRCLAESGTVTLRKRRLPLEMMVWCIVGMALERKSCFIKSLIAWISCCRVIVLLLPRAPLSRPVSDWEAMLSAECFHKQHSYGATLSRTPIGVG